MQKKEKWIKISELLEVTNLIIYKEEINNKKTEIRNLFKDTDIKCRFNMKEERKIEFVDTIRGGKRLSNVYYYTLELYVRNKDEKRATKIINDYDRIEEELPEELKEYVPENVAKRNLPLNIFGIILIILIGDIPLLLFAISTCYDKSETTNLGKTIIWIVNIIAWLITFYNLYREIKKVKEQEINKQ